MTSDMLLPFDDMRLSIRLTISTSYLKIWYHFYLLVPVNIRILLKLQPRNYINFNINSISNLVKTDLLFFQALAAVLVIQNAKITTSVVKSASYYFVNSAGHNNSNVHDILNIFYSLLTSFTPTNNSLTLIYQGWTAKVISRKLPENSHLYK